MFPKRNTLGGPGMSSTCRTKIERSHLQYQASEATMKNKTTVSTSIVNWGKAIGANLCLASTRRPLTNKNQPKKLLPIW